MKPSVASQWTVASPSKRRPLAGERWGLPSLIAALVVALPAVGHDAEDHEHGSSPTAEPTVIAPGTRGATARVDSVVEARSKGTPEGGIAVGSGPVVVRTSDAAGLLALGDALMQRSRDGDEAGLLDRAEEAYRRASELEPGNPQAWVGLGWVANTRHDFEAGRRWLKQALAKDPNLPEAHALLGDAAVEAGDYDEAFEHYQAALDRRPDLASYSRAAHLLWITGQPARARRLMEKAIAAGGPHAENVAWCRAELAMMMFHEGALLPAEDLLKRAVADAPENPHVLAAMGRLRMARKDYAAAVEFYRRAAERQPRHASLAALVDLHVWMGRTNEAEQATRRLLAFHESHDHAHPPSAESPSTHPPSEDADESDAPGHPSRHSHSHSHAHAHGDAELARFLADHEMDLDRALAEAEEAYREFKNVGVTDTLAWCYYRKNRLEDARRHIRRALKWGTPDARMLYHAGMIHAGLGDRTAARQFLYRALSLNPLFHPIEAETASRTLRELAAASAPDALARHEPR